MFDHDLEVIQLALSQINGCKWFSLLAFIFFLKEILYKSCLFGSEFLFCNIHWPLLSLLVTYIYLCTKNISRILLQHLVRCMFFYVCRKYSEFKSQTDASKCTKFAQQTKLHTSMLLPYKLQTVWIECIQLYCYFLVPLIP